MPLLDGNKCRLLIWVGALGQALGFVFVFGGFIKRGDPTPIYAGFAFAIASGFLLVLTIIRAANHPEDKRYLIPAIAVSVFWILIWINLPLVGEALAKLLSLLVPQLFEPQIGR